MKIFIAEDEPLASAKLKVFLQRLGETEITVFDNGLALLSALSDKTPEVLFLDIHMPGATGMEVMDLMKKKGIKNVQIIITSAYDQYAIESFNFNVTDYLLKPYTLDRLRIALDKAKTNLRLLSLDKQANSETISVRCDGKTIKISLLDIVLIESLKDYVQITTSDGQKRITLGTLASFEEKLPAYFVRVHRSSIINVNHVVEFNSLTVIMQGGEQIAIGKTYREQFENLLSKK